MNETNAKKLLFEIDDILRSAGLEYQLYAGTVLGAVRDGGFIKVDKDIDLGCLWEDFIEKVGLLIRELIDHGFNIEVVDHRHQMPWDGRAYAIKFAKYGEHGDLAAFIWNGDDRWCPSHASTFAVVYPAYMIEDLVEIELYGRKFKIPKATEEYLVLTYGPDWRIPDKEHRFRSHEKCIVYSYEGQGG